MKTRILIFIFCAQCLPYIYSNAQERPDSLKKDTRTQYPKSLTDSYFGVNIGYINYPFTQSSMEPGYTVESVQIPHVAVRILLLGHQFNKNISAQISYMRPVNWVKYRNVNGDHSFHSVWMNVAGLTVKAQTTPHKKFSVYGEAGFDIVTRHGFTINNIPVVKDVSYTSLLTGAGIQYHINNKWDLVLGGVWSPKNKNKKQPSTTFISGGFNFHMRPLPEEKVKRNAGGGCFFPENLLQIGYSTNGMGYGVNDFVSKGAIPIFWGGSSQMRRGLTVQYQRNIFHARKVFALDWGAGIGWWQSRKKKDEFVTISLYPVFRFIALRTKPIDLYFHYTVAGPSFISRKRIDDENTGEHFTFYDVMGIGAFAGKNRRLNADIRIAHYSNGNIFPQNAGVMIPLTFSLGYTW